MMLEEVKASPNSSGADELLPTRQSLISRLKDWDDQESWNTFFNLYWKLIYTAARRNRLTDAEAQDVVQETVISVCRAMPAFKYDRKQGSFKSWLLQLTCWRIKDQLRRRSPLQPVLAVPDAEDVSELGDDIVNTLPIGDAVAAEVEQTWEKEWESNLLEAAIERVKQQIDPKQFQLFDLSVLHGWPGEKISSVLGVGAATLYMARHRVAKIVKKELKRIRKQWS